MRLSIPANYDSSILGELKNNSAFEVYGRLNFDVTGGGRPNYMAAPLSRRRLEAFIADTHKAGLEFNYLMNSACLGNREWTRSFHKEFDALLDWLAQRKVETITVAVPYLLELIKRKHPEFKVKVGIYAQVDTVKRAKYWEDLGADAINLASFSINRDFEKLDLIRKSVKSDLVLIANHFCQPNCPYQIQHQNGHAHSSGKKTSFYIDYPIMQCQHNRLRNPALFISAGWIRPEDLKAYEEMGYTTFKLLERNIPSSQLLQRARAYHAGRYDGNLADLLMSFGFTEDRPNFSWTWLARTFQPWKMNLTKTKTMLGFLKSQGMLVKRDNAATAPAPVTIRTADLPADFIQHFKKGSCLDRDCAKCGYCAAVARKAVSLDREFLDKVLPVYGEVQESLWNGSMYGLGEKHPRANVYKA